MSKLRPNTKQQIYKALDQTHFTRYDFDIVFFDDIRKSEIGDDGEKPIFKITSLLNSEFTYSATHAKESDTQDSFQTIESPGEHFYAASIWNHRNFNGCIRFIFVSVIRTNMTASPISSQLNGPRLYLGSDGLGPEGLSGFF